MRTKSPIALALVYYFFTCQKVSADVFFWPSLCTNGSLQIQNNSNNSRSVWLQKFTGIELKEFEVALPANQTTNLTLNYNEASTRYSILATEQPEYLKIFYNCNNELHESTKKNGGTLTFKKTISDENKLWLENLYNDNNNFEIEFQDKNFKPLHLQKINLAAFQKLTLNSMKTQSNWTYLKVTSTFKSLAYLLHNNKSKLPIKTTPQQSEVDLTGVYFIVGSRTDDQDNFTVKIVTTQLIEQARDLIKNPQKEKMVFAKIKKSHSGFNRNWARSERNFWSWSTSEVTGFGELGSTSCNGTPQSVEDRLDYWVNDPGRICFWNYRIKKEISAAEVSAGLLNH